MYGSSVRAQLKDHIEVALRLNAILEGPVYQAFKCNWVVCVLRTLPPSTCPPQLYNEEARKTDGEEELYVSLDFTLLFSVFTVSWSVL